MVPVKRLGWAGGVEHKAMVLVCLPLMAPIGLSPLHILTLCGSERLLVVSTRGGGSTCRVWVYFGDNNPLCITGA